MEPLVLVVDDTKMFRVTYGDRLKALGYEVELAADGVEGLELARKLRPDLILLDLVMPGIGGFEVLKQLKENPKTKDIPIIILTSAGGEEDFKSALRLGADDFLQKTVTSPALIDQKIRKLISNEKREEIAKTLAMLRPFKIAVRDREYDAENLLREAGFKQHFLCPRCQEEIVLELIPDGFSEEEHKFKAYFVCSKCNKRF